MSLLMPITKVSNLYAKFRVLGFEVLSVVIRDIGTPPQYFFMKSHLNGWAGKVKKSGGANLRSS